MPIFFLRGRALIRRRRSLLRNWFPNSIRVPFLGLFGDRFRNCSVFGIVPLLGLFQFANSVEIEAINFDLPGVALTLSGVSQNACVFETHDGSDHCLSVQAAELT